MRAEVAAEVPALRILFDEARRVGDTRTAATCLDRLSWLAWVLLDGELGRECALEVAQLDVPPQAPEAFRLAVRRATDQLQTGNAKGALETLDAAERHGKRLDIDAFVAYLGVRADVLSALGESDSAIECARLAYSIALKRPSQNAVHLAQSYLAYAYEAAGSLRESLPEYDRAAALAERGNLGWEAAHSHARAAWVAFLLGDAGGARTRLLASLRAQERTPWLDVTRAQVGIHLGLALGDESLVESFADERHLDRALASEDAYSIGRTLGAFADLYHVRGEVDKVRELIGIALDRCTSAACMWALFAKIATHGDHGDIVRARALLDEFPPAHPLASAHRRMFDAVLLERRGDATAAMERSGEAFLLFESIGAKHYAAIALGFAGRFTESRARLRECGYLGFEARIEARASRGRPRLSYEATQQRREILALVVQANTNREIARLLGLSERTVKTRISEIYARTGTSRRSELHEGLLALL